MQSSTKYFCALYEHPNMQRYSFALSYLSPPLPSFQFIAIHDSAVEIHSKFIGLFISNVSSELPLSLFFFSCFICNFFRAIIKEIHCIRKSRCKKRATTRTLNSFFVVADFLYIYSLLMDLYLTKNLHTMQRE